MPKVKVSEIRWEGKGLCSSYSTRLNKKELKEFLAKFLSVNKDSSDLEVCFKKIPDKGGELFFVRVTEDSPANSIDKFFIDEGVKIFRFKKEVFSR